MANERMINSISCGIVFVEGPGNYEIPLDERIFVGAEIQEGLDQIAGYQPAANISWTLSGYTVTLPAFDPTAGSNFVGLPINYYKGFDAALWNKLNSRICFFKDDEFISIDPNNGMTMDPGYPKPIALPSQGFPQDFTEDLDAALWNHTNDKVYFFKGDQFISVDPNNGWIMDAGYPKPINVGIPSLPGGFANGIDAATWAKDGKVYLFKGDKYVSIDPNNNWQIDPGFPKLTAGNWLGLGGAYYNGIDAVFTNGMDDKVYLFKNQAKVGNFFRVDLNTMQADTNKAQNTGLGWGFEEVWRDQAQAMLNYGPGKSGAFVLSDDLQSAAGTQYGFVVFITKYPTAWHGYVNGKKMIIRKSGADRGPVTFENWTGLSKVIAHETAHIFGAADEYGGNSCGKNQGRFIKTTNGNSINCPPPTVSCIMRNSSVDSICDFSRKSVGWWAFLEGIDAGFYNFQNQKYYLFSKDYFTRYSSNLSMDNNYPKPVSDIWPSLNIDLSDGLDAALWNGANDKIYIFKGNQLIQIDPSNGWQPDPGFPQSIASNLNVPAAFQDGIDAALWNQKDSLIALFKGSEYLLLDPNNSNMLPGYPKQISLSFPGIPVEFEQGIDSAIWSELDNSVYFFKNGAYVKIDPFNAWTVEPNYPKWINNNWDMPFPENS